MNDFEKAEDIDAEKMQSEMEAATALLEKAASKKDKLEANQKARASSARAGVFCVLSFPPPRFSTSRFEQPERGGWLWGAWGIECAAQVKTLPRSEPRRSGQKGS